MGEVAWPSLPSLETGVDAHVLLGRSVRLTDYVDRSSITEHLRIRYGPENVQSGVRNWAIPATSGLGPVNHASYFKPSTDVQCMRAPHEGDGKVQKDPCLRIDRTAYGSSSHIARLGSRASEVWIFHRGL